MNGGVIFLLAVGVIFSAVALYNANKLHIITQISYIKKINILKYKFWIYISPKNLCLHPLRRVFLCPSILEININLN